MKWDLDDDGVIYKGEFKPPYAPPHPEALTIEDLEQLQRDLLVAWGYIQGLPDDAETEAAIERLRKWLPEGEEG